MAREIRPDGVRYDVVLWTEQAGRLVRAGVWLEGFVRKHDADYYCADANRMAREANRRAEYRVEERQPTYREKRYPTPPAAEGVNL